MTFYVLRRTILSGSLLRLRLRLRHDPASNLTTNSSHFAFFFSPYSSSSSSSSTLVFKTPKPTSDITEYLISRHQISPEAASKAASVLIHLNNYERRWELVVDYLLKECGLSKSQLEDSILRDPRLLVASLNHNIKPKSQTLRDLGFSPPDLAILLSSVPGIFTINNSADRLGSSVRVLQSVVGSNWGVVKLLKVCNWFLASDLDRTMMPNIQLLTACGISLSQIRQILFSFPRTFLHKTEFLEDCVRRVDEMGLSRNSKMYLHAVRALSSMSREKWESKLKLFRSLGLSEDDILCVFRKTPQVFAISERKITEVSNLLLSSGSGSGSGSESVGISFVVQHPELLIYSATHRIRPRMQIIHILHSKSLLPRVPRLTSIFKMPDEKFIRRFVLPFADQVGEAGQNYIMYDRETSNCCRDESKAEKPNLQSLY